MHGINLHYFVPLAYHHNMKACYNQNTSSWHVLLNKITTFSDFHHDCLQIRETWKVLRQEEKLHSLSAFKSVRINITINIHNLKLRTQWKACILCCLKQYFSINLRKWQKCSLQLVKKVVSVGCKKVDSDTGWRPIQQYEIQALFFELESTSVQFLCQNIEVFPESFQVVFSTFIYSRVTSSIVKLTWLSGSALEFYIPLTKCGSSPTCSKFIFIAS